MVWQVARAVKIPVIGIGGIMTADDAIEFFLAGASAIQVGTANFVDPEASIKIIEGIKSYVETRMLSGVKDLIGKVNV
jgi:dihydroorotate dehydrogenase (NAD+) catalytic subunit